MTNEQTIYKHYLLNALREHHYDMYQTIVAIANRSGSLYFKNRQVFDAYKKLTIREKNEVIEECCRLAIHEEQATYEK